MTDAWLEAHPDAGPLRRRLVEGKDRMQRALRARARDRAPRQRRYDPGGPVSSRSRERELMQ
jgi:hypothetical protein